MADVSAKAEHDEREEQIAQHYRETATAFDPMTGEIVASPRPPYRKRPFVPLRCMKSSTNALQFGTKDLVITGDFKFCSSELENCYGIGLAPGSSEAKVCALLCICCHCNADPLPLLDVFGWN